MPKLTFDPEKHEYRIDGIIIPSYSKIARDMGLVDYSHCNQRDLDYKQQVGQAVHTSIFYHNTDELDMDSLDEVTSSYFKSWLMFIELYRPKILTEYSENPICSFKWKYGVTPDIVVEQKGGLTVIELKTVSQMNPVTALQTTAQKVALEETYNIKIKQRWGLQLIPDTMPKLAVYTEPSDNTAWLSIINSWHWKERNNLWKP